MVDDNTPKEPKAEGRTRAGSPRTKAQAEFDKYKARVGAQPRAAAGARGFGQPPAFSIQGMPMRGWAPMASMSGGVGGASWGGPGYGQMAYGGPMPPQLGPDSLTDRLRMTLRLGVDVLNATLTGGLRVMGGLSDITAWAWSDPARGYRSGHCGCGCGSSCSCHSSCSCDCCSVLSCDPCCSPGVSSCGCGCC
jgi:hypothetical protein